MYARILTLTKAIDLAARQTGLERRTIIKLPAHEWAELNSDEQFRLAFSGQPYVVINRVIVTEQEPVKPST